MATVLSAQMHGRGSTWSPPLFATNRSAADYAAADREELEETIRSTGFFTPRRQLEGARRRARGAYGGEVPRRLDDLVACPASGARPRTSCWATRSASLASPWTPTSAGWPAGSAGRARPTRRRSRPTSPRCCPDADWTAASDRMILHGRRVCHSRRPACGACGLAPAVPLVRHGPRRPGAGGQAGQAGPP